MLRDIAEWWAAQMLDLLPEGWRPGHLGTGPALLIEPEAEEEPGRRSVRLILRRRGRESELGHANLDDPASLRRLVPHGRPPPVLLRLPRGRLLERPMEMPIAAEGNLRQVLRHEMDRVTPFAISDVHWGWTVEERDRARGRLRLRLMLVPRAPLMPLLRLLRETGIPPLSIVVPSAAGRLCCIEVEPPRSPGRGDGRRGLVALTSVCAVVAMTAAALPFLLQSRALGEVEARIEDLRPRVTLVERLRARIAGSSAGGAVLAAEGERTGSLLRAIAVLTAVLPDNTSINSLGLRQRVLTVSGQSTAAASLIGLLSEVPGLHGPSFTAPVTRAPNGRAELFSLRAELGP